MLGRGLAVVLIALGVGAVVQTAVHGGGIFAYGYLFGALLVVTGVLRLYLSARLRRG